MRTAHADVMMESRMWPDESQNERSASYEIPSLFKCVVTLVTAIYAANGKL